MPVVVAGIGAVAAEDFAATFVVVVSLKLSFLFRHRVPVAIFSTQ